MEYNNMNTKHKAEGEKTHSLASCPVSTWGHVIYNGAHMKLRLNLQGPFRE